ncbi:UNVERIFIED_CONTAM: B9-C2 domain-containing protein [Hammondia hammondi]|eukprot:XP_008888702.1 B9-C2 domain-containing protein [Hammondia hammondi]
MLKSWSFSKVHFFVLSQKAWSSPPHRSVVSQSNFPRGTSRSLCRERLSLPRSMEVGVLGHLCADTYLCTDLIGESFPVKNKRSRRVLTLQEPLIWLLMVWNFPFSLIFKSTNPFGWPRLVICVYGTDWLNRRVVIGYTSVHVPTQPGRHIQTLQLYSITSSSWMQRLVAWATGCRPEYVDPQTAARSEGREVVRTSHAGRIKVCFNVLSRDLQQLQYSL